MKKYTVLFAGLSLALAFTSCGSSESAYKKAYEKAKSMEAAQQVNTGYAPAQDPVAVAPVTTTTPTPSAAPAPRVANSTENVSVRQEHVSLIDGAGLRAYSVVVGSFGLRSNAETLQQQLRNGGYEAQIVKNEANGMFRVVATTFDNKADAVSSRNSIRGSQYNPKGDAWLLFNVQ